MYSLSTDGRTKFLKSPEGRIMRVSISAPVILTPSKEFHGHMGFSLTWTETSDLQNFVMKAGIDGGVP